MKIVVIFSVAHLVRAVIFFSQFEISHVLNGQWPKTNTDVEDLSGLKSEHDL